MSFNKVVRSPAGNKSLPKKPTIKTKSSTNPTPTNPQSKQETRVITTTTQLVDSGKVASLRILRPSKTPEDLRVKFAAKLQSSGLNLETAAQLQFKLLTAEDIASLGLPAFDGFAMPYFDLDGQPTDFYRVRYLESTKRGVLKQTNKKELRYVQPADTVNEVYIPPLIDWSEHLDSDEPIIITEGELKAACATRRGFPTIGLGGVWCFRSARNGIALLPIFENLKLKGRTVYIVFDSDVVSNPNVLMAESVLAGELVQLGAQPAIVRLPPTQDGKKVGLDDYLETATDEDFLELLRNARPDRQAAALQRLNSEVIFVRYPGLVYVMADHEKLSPKVFTDHVYANRTYHKEVQTKNGPKLEECNTAKEWLKWPLRAEVGRMVYAPGQPMITDNNHLNVWKGWGAEPEVGDVSPWLMLLDFIFDGEPESRSWFEKWLAYPLQNPGVKMFTATVVWGRAMGTGKSLIGYTIGKIYGDNFIEIDDDALSSGDNDYAENKQFAMGDEVTGGDKRGVADHLKSLITRENVRVNIKYVPRYTMADTINYYFTSNHPDSFFIDDKDRRFFVHEVLSETPLPEEFYKKYDAWYKGKGPNYLFNYLLQVDTEDFNPRTAAPMTRAKLDMIDTGRSDIGSWVSQLRNDPDSVLRIDNVILPFRLWRSEDLLKVYDPQGNKRLTANGVARELRRAGFHQVYRGQGCKTSMGSVKLWAVREIQRMLRIDNGVEYGRIYDEERSAVEKRSKF